MDGSSIVDDAQQRLHARANILEFAGAVWRRGRRQRICGREVSRHWGTIINVRRCRRGEAQRAVGRVFISQFDVWDVPCIMPKMAMARSFDNPKSCAAAYLALRGQSMVPGSIAAATGHPPHSPCVRATQQQQQKKKRSHTPPCFPCDTQPRPIPHTISPFSHSDTKPKQPWEFVPAVGCSAELVLTQFRCSGLECALQVAWQHICYMVASLQWTNGAPGNTELDNVRSKEANCHLTSYSLGTWGFTLCGKVGEKKKLAGGSCRRNSRYNLFHPTDRVDLFFRPVNRRLRTTLLTKQNPVSSPTQAKIIKHLTPTLSACTYVTHGPTGQPIPTLRKHVLSQLLRHITDHHFFFITRHHAASFLTDAKLGALYQVGPLVQIDILSIFKVRDRKPSPYRVAPLVARFYFKPKRRRYVSNLLSAKNFRDEGRHSNDVAFPSTLVCFYWLLKFFDTR